MYPKQCIFVEKMDMDVRFYLKRPAAKTKTAVKARICFDGKKLEYYLPGVSIHPKEWNSEEQCMIKSRSHPNHLAFNSRLKDYSSKITAAIDRFCNDNNQQFPSIAILKEILDQMFKKNIRTNQKQKVINFMQFFAQIIDEADTGQKINYSTQTQVTKGTVRNYRVTYKTLENFIKRTNYRLDFETINMEFHKRFVGYIINDLGQSNNTAGKHIKQIKAIMNEAVEEKLTTNTTFKSKRFVRPQEDTFSIYLTEQEIEALHELDLSDTPTLIPVRDLLVIACYTGQRYSDFSQFRIQQINNGFLNVEQIKTGTYVVIPLHPTVLQIIKSYGNNFPPAISNQKMNMYLKEIAKKCPLLQEEITLPSSASKKDSSKCPKWQLITTHIGRRSFATNEFDRGTPTLEIMSVTGHKSEKTFYKYIKKTPTDHAQSLGQRWQKRYEEI